MPVFKTLLDGLKTGQWRPYFPDDLTPDSSGLVCVGGELTIFTLMEAYARGIFPWSGDQPIPWFSPDPRLILVPEKFRASNRLRRIARQNRFAIRFDTNFRSVMENCATVPRKGQNGTWISGNMIPAYGALHDLGIAHSVEVYHDGQLCGGLYGLCLGRAFFGESMFSKVSNASKLALYALCQFLGKEGFHFIDCQQTTAHLMSLGAEPVSREHFLQLLGRALAFPSLHHSWAGCEQIIILG